MRTGEEQRTGLSGDTGRGHGVNWAVTSSLLPPDPMGRCSSITSTAPPGKQLAGHHVGFGDKGMLLDIA